MTQFVKLIVLLLLSIVLIARAAIEVDEGVLVLTDDNFEEAITANPAILVEFYAPWCGHCKQLAPEYSKAAKSLAAANENVKLAKVDATEQKKIAEKFEVKGFPTLKYFKNGKATEYGGGRSESEIVDWLKKKSGPAYRTLASELDLTIMQEQHEAFVLGVFSSESSPLAKKFIAFAESEEDLGSFAVTYDPTLKTKLALSAEAVVVMKTFDDKRADHVFTSSEESAFDIEALKSFVIGESTPLIQVFSPEASKKIFKSPIQKHALVFTVKGDVSHTTTMDVFSKVASTLKGKFLFVNVPSTESKVLEFFDLKESDLPAMILGDMGHESGMKKYPYKGSLASEEEVSTFFADYSAGKIQPTLKSEDVLPEDTAGDVVVLKGKSFHDLVINNDKDVLVEFYAPWCGHCKKLAPTYDELGKKFKNVENIVIAKMDSTANEVDVPGMQVRGFPSLYFFKGNDKGNPIKYEDGRELDDFVKYLQNNAHQKFNHDEL